MKNTVMMPARIAVLAAILLLLSNSFAPERMRTYLSSFSLALSGICYALLQVNLRAGAKVVVKRFMLAAAFVLWAVIPFLANGRLAAFLNDVVIAAYVLDLFWAMQHQQQKPS